jgi:hypothetical protein
MRPAGRRRKGSAISPLSLSSPSALTKADYESADFAGIDAGAVWEDFKVGMEHLSRWERVALVTDVEWMKQTMRFFSFLMPGATKAFPLAKAAEARAWIVSGQ